MGVTIKDIAEEAGVSVSTVSRVLNNKPDVNDKTKEKVQRVINKLNYNPNGIARGLVLKKTNTIGLIIPSITNPFFPTIAKGVEDEARKLGYSVVFCNTDNEVKHEKEIINLMKTKKVDGIIASFCINDVNELNKLITDHFAVVQVDREISGLETPVVIIDNVLSGYLATTHLIKLGHRKIAHITGQPEVKNTKDRLAGYKKALRENGISFNEDWVLFGDPQKEKSGYKQMNYLLKEEDRPTGVFITNDIMAIRAYKAIFDHGLTIPGDISIIGHDDIEMASIIRPSLTTIRQPKYKLGQMAARVIIDQINGGNNSGQDVLLKPELVIRESTARV